MTQLAKVWRERADELLRQDHHTEAHAVAGALRLCADELERHQEKSRRKLELALGSLRASMSDAASAVVQLQEQAEALK